MLKHYHAILEEHALPRYVLSKYVPVDYSGSESVSGLWELHKKAFGGYKVEDVCPDQSLLDLKRELAQHIFSSCVFCEHRCQIDRNQQAGACGVQKARIASEFLHMGEEPFLIPSYTVFFSGCTFQCVFCQNWDISQQLCGLEVAPDKLAELITVRTREGARNVNWVGGDPTSNLLYILVVLNSCTSDIPQVWNSNMYCSEETMRLLDGVIDVFLTDFKYGNNGCAQRLSKVPNYWEVVTRNHRLAGEQAEVVIRHLVLPGHVECCSKPVMRWIAEFLPEAVVNVMGQYHPAYQAQRYDELAFPVDQREVEQVKEYAQQRGLFLV